MHSFIAHASRTRTVALLTVLLVVGQASAAFAHEDPSGCIGTGVSISLTLYRADGTTPVAGAPIEDGETVVYQTTLALPPNACSFEGGSITITPPGAPGGIDVTPDAGIPCIGPNAPCVASVDSKQLAYVVTEADQDTVSNQRRVTASTRYGGGFLHDGDPDGQGPTATTTRTTVVAHPDLKVVKTPDNGITNAGTPAAFAIVVTNAGFGSAKDVKLEDTLPNTGGLTWSESPNTAECAIAGDQLSCDIGTLAPGASFSVTVSTPTSYTDKGKLNNLATASTSSVELAGAVPAADDDSDTGDITITAPSLGVTKTADASPVDDGDSIGYTISVVNNGDGAATAAALNDALPTGPGIAWSIDPAYSGPGTCGITGNALSCSFGTLAPAATASVHVTSPTTADSEGDYPNTASFTASNAAPATASASITVLPPGLQITKAVDDSPVSAGEQIGFTVGVKNSGTGTAKSVTLDDPLPTSAGFSWSIDNYTGPGSCDITGGTLSCAFGNLSSGSSTSVHVISSTAKGDDGTYVNTATANATNSKTPVKASATVVVQPVLLKVVKTADDAVVSDGDTIGFGISVTNLGPGKALNATLSDPLPGGSGVNWSISPAYSGPGTCAISGTAPSQSLDCSFGTLAFGASVSVHVSSGTNSSSEKTYVNTATASASNSADASDDAQVIVQPVGLGILKTADRASVTTTDGIGFTITTTNAGPGVARAATLNDPLPAGPGLNWSISPAYAGPGTCAITGVATQTLACAFGDLAAGSAIPVHVASATTPDSAGTYPNTATASATNAPAPKVASASLTVLKPVLAITKVADLTPVSTTEPIGFTIGLTNTGLGKSYSTKLTDPLPGGNGVAWSISPAYAGPGTCAITGSAPQTLKCFPGILLPGAGITVHVVSGTTRASAGTYGNTATGEAKNNSPVTAAASIDVLAPKLSITKTSDKDQIFTGENLGFTITVKNSGEGNALGATLSDPLPGHEDFNWTLDAYTGPGTCAVTGVAPIQNLNCAFGTIAPGQSVSVHVTTTTTHICDGLYENVATVDAINDGPLSASATFEILKSGLSLTNTADDAIVRGGTNIAFRATVSNAGPDKVVNAVLSEPLPTGPGLAWTIAPAYSGPGSCSIASGKLSCSFGDMAKGDSATVRIQSVTTAASKGIYTAIATAKGQNNPVETAAASTQVLGVPTPKLSVSGCDKLVPGGKATFTFVATNTGNAPSTATSVRVTLPAGLDVLDANDADVSLDGRTVEWTIGTLDPGTTVTHHLTVGVSANSGKTLTISVALRTDEVPAVVVLVKRFTTVSGAKTHGNARAWKPTVFGNLVETTYDRNSSASKPGPAQKSEWDGINLWTNIQGPIAMRHWHADTVSQVTQTASSSHAIAYFNNLNVLYGAIEAQEVRAEANSTANALGASSNFNGSHFVDLKINGQRVANAPAPNATYSLYSPQDPTLLIGSVVLNEQSSSTSGTSTSNSLTMIHVRLIHSFMGMEPGFELIISHAATDATFPDGSACK
jgi:uncharacterized repeat protein (TIGR01451 family)